MHKRVEFLVSLFTPVGATAGSARTSRQFISCELQNAIPRMIVKLCLSGAMFLSLTATNIAIAQRTVISPSEFATTEAPDVANVSGFPSYRFQQLYGAADFESLGPGPHIITRVDWRPGREMTETISYPAERFLMKFSTTRIDPADVLDRTFDNNIGSGEQTVFDGPVTLTTENLGPAEGPKAFDYGLDLQTPFAYDPAAGNLLMDLTVINGQGPLLLDFTFADTNTTSFHWTATLGPDSEVAAEDFGGHILQFTVVPEPTSMALMSGCVFLVLMRRRRAL